MLIVFIDYFKIMIYRYEIMKSCWNIEPAQRLSFKQLVELIGEILGTEEVEVS